MIDSTNRFCLVLRRILPYARAGLSSDHSSAVGQRSSRRMDKKVPQRQWSGAMCYMIRAQCTQLTTSTTLK